MSEAGTDAPQGDDSPRTRTLSPMWRVVLTGWTLLSIAMCFNQQFTLRFFMDVTLLDTEYYWALVGLLLPLAFIIYPARRGRHADHVPLYDVALFVLATAITVVLIATSRRSALEGWEYSAHMVAPGWVMAAAVMMWLLVLEALRRAGGFVLFAIMAVFSAFPLFSGLMPAPLTSPSVELLETASYHIFSRESVLGIPMRAFAELVIGFLVFGTALQYTGAGAFFIDFAFALCGHMRGGAAKVAKIGRAHV